MERDEDPCYLLDKASRILKCRFNSRLAEIGVTFPQLIAVKCIADANAGGEEATPAAIAARTGYDRATVTGILDRLEREEFIRRAQNRRDRRSQTIELAEKAGRLLREMDAYFEQTRDSALSGFDSEETERLKTALRRIIENMEHRSAGELPGRRAGVRQTSAKD